MPSQMRKPVLFFAYANTHPGDDRYLRNLADEQRRIRTTLEAATESGLCDTIERNNATLADVLDVFQKNRDRIAVFHYAGHANSFELLLETPKLGTAAIDGRALASFLGQQRGLELVFLNGCATSPQVDSLLAANVAVVIATVQAIDDGVATEFADRFYRGLASGASLGKAYHEARDALRAAQHIAVWRDLEPSTVATAGAAWPWLMQVRPGAERARDWNLPEASRSPLFGLPALAAGDLSPQPFRHLRWFDREHAEIFFGRGSAIRELYERTTDSKGAPVILFYGQAGVGKSSVLAAGLLPRLEQVAEVVYLRRDRERGLAATLTEALRNAEPLPSAPGSPPAQRDSPSVVDAWRRRETERGRPLVVVLDQVEGAYTRTGGVDADELRAFLELTASLFVGSPQARPRGKLVLSFRKEWLPEIEQQLLDHRLYLHKVFLARLDRNGVLEAITGMVRDERLAKHYHLAVADGLADVIADDLLADAESPLAPTLQILLTKMWDATSEGADGRRHFDVGLYQRLKKAGILLRDFFDQQLAAMAARYPAETDSGLVLDLLAHHTTPLGTAEQRSASEIEQRYAHRKDAVLAIAEELKGLYLLADPPPGASTKATRLAHDTLAPIVLERFNASQHPGQRARRIVESRVADWAQGARGAPLDDRDLRLVESGIDAMRGLEHAERRLLEASRAAAKRRRWRNRVLRGALIALSLGLIGTGLFLYRRNQEIAERNRELARQAAQQYMRDAQDAVRTHDVSRRVLSLALVLSTAPQDDPLRTSAMAALLDAVPGMPQLLAVAGPTRAGALSPDRGIAVVRDPSGGVETWDIAQQRRLSTPSSGGALSGFQLDYSFFSPVVSRSGRFAALVVPQHPGTWGETHAMRLMVWEIDRHDILIDHAFAPTRRPYPEWGPKDLLVLLDNDEQGSFLQGWRPAGPDPKRSFTLRGACSSLAPDDEQATVVQQFGNVGAFHFAVVHLDGLSLGSIYEAAPKEAIEADYALPDTGKALWGSIEWHFDGSFDVNSADPWHCSKGTCTLFKDMQRGHPRFFVSVSSPRLEASIADDSFFTGIRPSAWTGEDSETNASFVRSLLHGDHDGDVVVPFSNLVPPDAAPPLAHFRAGPRHKALLAVAGPGEIREIDLGRLSSVPVRAIGRRWVTDAWNGDASQLWTLTNDGHVMRWPTLLGFPGYTTHPSTTEDKRAFAGRQRIPPRRGEPIDASRVPGRLLASVIEPGTGQPVVAYAPEVKGDQAERFHIAALAPDGLHPLCEGDLDSFGSFREDEMMFLIRAGSGLQIRSLGLGCQVVFAGVDRPGSHAIALFQHAWTTARTISLRSDHELSIGFTSSSWTVITEPGIEILDDATRERIASPDSPLEDGTSLLYAALSRDGRRLITEDAVAASYQPSCYRVWDLSTGTMIAGPLCQGSEEVSMAMFSDDATELIVVVRDLRRDSGVTYRYPIGPTRPEPWRWATPEAIAALTGLSRSSNGSIVAAPDAARARLEDFEQQLTQAAAFGESAAVQMLVRLHWWCGHRPLRDCGAARSPGGAP